MENTSSVWQSFVYISLTQLLFHIPIIAIYIVGIVISFTKSKKHPKISLFSGAAFGIMLLLSILSVLIAPLAPYLVSQRYDAQSIGFTVSSIGFVITLVNVGAVALLLIAVWKDRP